ncbi:MAG: WD40 repeat domain-containing protein [Planctomycetes bacterium]|nr:WD40 repeat domain-containing protein [Planctomycetota bacterium]
MRVLKAMAGEVLDLAFSPDGRALAAAVPAGYDQVFLWNLESGAPTPVQIEIEGDYKGGLGFSPDNRRLGWLEPARRGTYDRDERELSYTSLDAINNNNTLRVTQSADGSRLISQHGLPNHCLQGWRALGDEWIRSWSISTEELAVESVTLSEDGRQFAMLTRPAVGEKWQQGPRRVEVRDTTTGMLRGVGEYPYNYAEPLLFSPDGRQLVGFNDMTLLAWPVPEVGTLGTPRRIHNDNRKQFTALAYHPSGDRLYATSNDTTVHVFDTANWNWVGRFTWQLGRLKAVAVSPDGMLAAAGGDKGDVVIWDVDG